MTQTKIPLPISLILFALIAASLLLSLQLNPTSDITWRLHVANSTLAGAEIYRDLIETNPPLWFWSSLIWAQTAKTFNLSAYVVMCGGIHLIAGVALVLLDRLVMQILNRWERCAILLGFVGSFLFVTVGEIGQREQAFFVGGTLWVALASVRLAGRPVPTWQIVLVTLFAAYGFALKHFFVAVPVFIELWLVLELRRAYRPVRLETVLLGSAAVVYGVAVVYFAPLFLSRIVPLVSVAYDSFGSTVGYSLYDRISGTVINSAFVGYAFITLMLVKKRTSLTNGLVIFMILATIIMAVQFKGWRYHKLAAQGATFLILALALGTALGQEKLRESRELIVSLVCLISGGVLMIANPLSGIIRYNGQVVSSGLRDFVTSEPSNKRLVILSVAPEHAFYILDRAKRPQWSRHYSMWMLPGLQVPQSEPRAEAIRQGEFNKVRREFIDDITCAPPDVVISEAGSMRARRVIEIDTLGYLKQDLSFAAWFDAAYKPVEKFEVFTIWRLKGLKPAPGLCKRDP